MTDQSYEDLVQVPAQESAGAKLAREREAQGMSIVDVARALRLSVKQVESLEADQLDRLPGRTFVRGFVRNYARLLNLDPDQLVTEYLPLKTEVEVQHIQAPSQQIRFSEHHDRPWLKWLAGGFVSVALASWGVLEWLGPEAARPVVTPKVPMSAAPAPSGQPSAPQPSPLPESMRPTDTAPDAQAGEPVVLSAFSAGDVAAPAPASAPAAVNAALARLTLSFSGTAWVEARDKNGKKIHSQNNPPGALQTLEGEPPLSLIIGSAPNVKLTYKGQPVDLSAYTRADVARLTLE